MSDANVMNLNKTSATIAHDMKMTQTTAQLMEVTRATTLDEVLAMVDSREPSKFISMYGGRSTASEALRVLLSQNFRTPSHRRIVGVMIDAAKLPTHIEAWQHLIFSVLDKLSDSPTAPVNVIAQLRAELKELIEREKRKDPNTQLSAAAFAHHFRTAFPGLVNTCYAESNCILVVGISHLDHTNGVWAAELLEASKYFLTAPDCVTISAANEVLLADKLKHASTEAARMMLSWATSRIVVPERGFSMTKPSTQSETTIEPSLRGKSKLETLPTDCAKLILDLLSPDKHAVEVACDDWHFAMRALERRADLTSVNGVTLAKLVAFKTLSPNLFDALRLEPSRLMSLEKIARIGRADMNDEWQRTMAVNPKLTALFKSAPSFIGIPDKDFMAAMRYIHGNENANVVGVLRVDPAPAQRIKSFELNMGEAAQREKVFALPKPEFGLPQIGFPQIAPAVLLALSAVLAISADRLLKFISQPMLSVANFFANSVYSTALAMGAEMFAFATAILAAIFWGRMRESQIYPTALGLIIGGLASNLFDRITLGGSLNFLHVLNLPALNVAHLATFAGATMLSLFIVTDVVKRETND